jgi:hypothetical protein
MKQHTKKSVKTAQQDKITQEVVEQTADDFKSAVLVVSLVVNLFVLTAWLVIEKTDRYNTEIVNYIQR